MLEGSRLYAGRILVAYARPIPGDRGGRPRVGVAVSRQVKGAVRRNRVRRRLREAARLELLLRNPEGSGPRSVTYAVVLIARPAALDTPFRRLLQEVAAVRARLR